MKGILVDTSIIIDFLRQKDKSKTIQIKLEKSEAPLYISIITHTECFSGKSIWERKEALKALKLFFADINILPLEEKISEKAGKIRAEYNLNMPDAIIASTGITHNLKLATLNIKDFEKIQDIKLLHNISKNHSS